jgi:hypothetical protein
MVRATERRHGVRQTKGANKMIATQDLGLVAALQLHCIIPKETYYEKSRLVFRFDETTDFSRLREAYFAGRLHGPLSTYNSIVRALTVQIKEGVRHGR